MYTSGSSAKDPDRTKKQLKYQQVGIYQADSVIYFSTNQKQNKFRLMPHSASERGILIYQLL
jgi:hypothetical protein